ncbi:MAG TPA: hypothetical protein VGH07_03195 [Chthoniobacterales bacterium]|jgi:hypothetical protein
MSKIFRLLAALYTDGFKAISLFVPLLSMAFTVAKTFDAAPLLRDISYAWAFLPLTIWLLVAYIRRLLAFDEEIEAPRAPAMSLTPMNIKDIAEYLRDQSAWGWRTYRSLNFWRFVQDQVPSEMQRAGNEYQVRYTTFGASTSVPGLVHYQYGSALRSDVMRTWPPASISLKTGAVLCVWARKARAARPAIIVFVFVICCVSAFLLGFVVRWLGWH